MDLLDLRRFVIFLAAAAAISPSGALAQEVAPDQAPAEQAPAPIEPTPPEATPTPPTEGEPPVGELPPVDVIQDPTPTAPTAAPPTPAPEVAAPVPVVAPTPQPPPAVAEAPAAPTVANPIYGAQNSGGAAQRAYDGAMSPINPTSILPTNLENFTGDATIVTGQTIDEERPRTVNETFTRVPGVIVINDDGNAQHGGIGIRGSAPRRTRKILFMNDGQPVNLALWLDPSVHYSYPLDRIESFEIIRGTTIPYGPNNNFGVVNARNYSPFGPNHTVISGAVGITSTDRGFFDFESPSQEGRITGSDEHNPSGRWHLHTVQSHDNVGLVFSYTGESVKGAWDTERLRFNDFYGALGWKGVDSDLVMSATYARQRDNYDESNLELEDGNGLTPEQAFEQVKHCKLCFAPGAGFNTYNADIWRGQIAHNNYVDQDTTVTTRLYAQEHRRDRYQIVSLVDNPANPGAPVGSSPFFGVGFDEDGNPVPEDEFQAVYYGNGSMFGRLRTFRSVGSEVRAEFANLPFHGDMTQDVQVGIRYEYQDMTNRNFLGNVGQVLTDGDETGLTIFERNLDANAVSAFLQTDIQATRDLNIVPGIRFEWYKVKRQSFVIAEEEGEAEEAEEVGGAVAEDECEDGGLEPEDACFIINGIARVDERDSTSSFVALPGISFSYTGWYNTTLFGGYHRGLSTAVLRNEDFPAPDEIGDNFQVGLRSKAFLGLDLQVVGFYQFLHDYQFGASFTTASDRGFGRAPEVEIRGVELYGRIDSQPFTGGDRNWFLEGNYSYTNGIFTEDAFDRETGDQIIVSGNRLPEVPFNLAALTVGVEDKTYHWPWNASVTWTYRGEFFTDELNLVTSEEGEEGLVPSVWLLSARFNLDIGDTGASWYVAGYNLLDELYITDREDGIKPGIGRTLWTGFKYKF